MRYRPARRTTAALALVAGLAIAPPALAASFNCAKAGAPDEKAICASRTLSDLDVQMATLYGVRMQIPMLMGERGAAQDEQRAWLAGRRTCGGNFACLVQSHQQRIAELNEAVTAAMQDYCVRIGICG